MQADSVKEREKGPNKGYARVIIQVNNIKTKCNTIYNYLYLCALNR